MYKVSRRAGTDLSDRKLYQLRSRLELQYPFCDKGMGNDDTMLCNIFRGSVE